MADQHEPVLNSAGRIANYFIDSKLTPLFVLFCLIVGAIAVTLTPREENPQIIVPGAEIEYQLPGRTAEEVERLVIAPVERAMREIDGVDHTFAAATYGGGRVSIQFDVGVDKEKAMVRVFQRVTSIQPLLPTGTAPPLVRRLDADDVPILTVAISSEVYDDFALRRFAERIEERLSTIEAVSVTQIHGGRSREIRIELDPARLEAFGLTIDQGIATLSSSNVASVVGQHVGTDGRTLLSLQNRLHSAQDVESVAIAAFKGRLVYVRDVGTVIDGPSDEREHVTRFAFGPADPRHSSTHGEMSSVTLSIAKKPGTNAVTAAREVLETVESLRQKFVPEAVHIVTTRNDGETANDTVMRLSRDVIFAVSTVIIALLPFLGLRAGMIICFELPLILFVTLGIDLLTGHSINRMSLFAFIIALGMIVDDGIVTLENIYRSYQNGISADPLRQAVIAVNEVGPPTTLATIAIILVFGSLKILSGMNGEFFEPIAFNVMVTMGLSLIIAYMTVPWACHRWLRPHVRPSSENDHDSRVFSVYSKIVTPFLRSAVRRRWLYALTAAALAISLLQPMWQFLRPAGVGGPLSWAAVNLAIMPLENKNYFSITLDMPENTPLEVTDQVARRLGNVLLSEAVVQNYSTFVGIPGIPDFAGQVRGDASRTGANMAEIAVNLLHKSKRGTESNEVVARLRAVVTELKREYPGLDVRVLSSPAGPPSRATVLAEIYGPDAAQRRAAAAVVRHRFESTYGIVDIYDSESAPVPRIDYEVDREKAILSGITPGDVERVLLSVIEGGAISDIQAADERNAVPIVARIPHDKEIDPTVLDRLSVTNLQGQRVPLSELVRVHHRLHDEPILRKDNERVTYVGADTQGIAPIYAIFDMDKHLSGAPFGDGNTLQTGNLTPTAETPSTLNGYRLLWDGELRLTLEAFGEMTLVLSAALTFIFLLLVASYRSFVIPLVAMLAIPLGIIGVFPGHWLLGINFSMGSAIGIVALAGVVIRNSLLIIDFIQDYQRQGRSLDDAVRLAGAVRFRPIFLSALTVALGTLILYTDPLFAGLATSLIFGTLSSTALTLLILPTLYYQIGTARPEWILRR